MCTVIVFFETFTEAHAAMRAWQPYMTDLKHVAAYVVGPNLYELRIPLT